jgi:AcrR family transcriptional regulator
MAKTKSHLDRDEKRGEIVLAASQLFLERGFEATPVALIARQANVAPNTLYWYFADKDALLIAVLDSLVDEILGAFERRKKSSLEAQLSWLLGVLSRGQRLIATVHSRMETAEAVRVWHDAFHRQLEAAIERQLRAHTVARGNELHAARTTMFVIEGLLAHPCSRQEQRELVTWLVSVAQSSHRMASAARRN